MVKHWRIFRPLVPCVGEGSCVETVAAFGDPVDYIHDRVDEVAKHTGIDLILASTFLSDGEFKVGWEPQ
jgi:hypothetical protein